MTYDLVAHAFLDGKAASPNVSAEAVLNVLRPSAVADTADQGFCHTRTLSAGM